MNPEERAALEAAERRVGRPLTDAEVAQVRATLGDGIVATSLDPAARAAERARASAAERDATMAGRSGRAPTRSGLPSDLEDWIGSLPETVRSTELPGSGAVADWLGSGRAGTTGAVQGLTNEYGDEIMGAADTLMSEGLPDTSDIGEMERYRARYREARDRRRDAIDRDRANNPGLYTLGTIAGGAAIPIPGAGPSAGLGRRLAGHLGTGAALGAAGGIGASEHEMTDPGIAEGAAYGGAGGAIAGGVLGGLGEGVRGAVRAAPAIRRAADRWRIGSAASDVAGVRRLTRALGGSGPEAPARAAAAIRESGLIGPMSSADDVARAAHARLDSDSSAPFEREMLEAGLTIPRDDLARMVEERASAGRRSPLAAPQFDELQNYAARLRDYERPALGAPPTRTVPGALPPIEPEMGTETLLPDFTREGRVRPSAPEPLPPEFTGLEELLGREVPGELPPIEMSEGTVPGRRTPGAVLGVPEDVIPLRSPAEERAAAVAAGDATPPRGTSLAAPEGPTTRSPWSSAFGGPRAGSGGPSRIIDDLGAGIDDVTVHGGPGVRDPEMFYANTGTPWPETVDAPAPRLSEPIPGETTLPGWAPGESPLGFEDTALAPTSRARIPEPPPGRDLDFDPPFEPDPVPTYREPPPTGPGPGDMPISIAGEGGRRAAPGSVMFESRAAREGARAGARAGARDLLPAEEALDDVGRGMREMVDAAYRRRFGDEAMGRYLAARRSEEVAVPILREAERGAERGSSHVPFGLRDMMIVGSTNLGPAAYVGSRVSGGRGRAMRAHLADRAADIMGGPGAAAAESLGAPALGRLGRAAAAAGGGATGPRPGARAATAAATSILDRARERAVVEPPQDETEAVPAEAAPPTPSPSTSRRPRRGRAAPPDDARGILERARARALRVE